MMVAKIRSLENNEKDLTSTRVMRCQFEIKNSTDGKQFDLSKMDNNSLLAQKIN